MANPTSRSQKPTSRSTEPWRVDTEAAFVNSVSPTPDGSALSVRFGLVRFYLVPQGAEAADVATLGELVRELCGVSRTRGAPIYVKLWDPRGRPPRKFTELSKPPQTERWARLGLIAASLEHQPLGHWYELVLTTLMVEHGGTLGARVRAGDAVHLVIRVPEDEGCRRLAEVVVANVQAICRTIA
ncbi:MAG: hypothetical protein ABFE08_16365 [Armatimonadia bacterium]